jgi:hypothetical protein
MSKENPNATVVAADAVEATVKNFKTIGSVTFTEEQDTMYKKLLNQLDESGADDTIVRATLRKGIKFKVTGIATDNFDTTDRDGNPVNRVVVRVCTNVGAQILPKHFASLEDLDVTIGTSKEDIAAFVAYHSVEGTEFEVKKFTPKQGTFGQDDYVPEYAELVEA